METLNYIKSGGQMQNKSWLRYNLVILLFFTSALIGRSFLDGNTPVAILPLILFVLLNALYFFKSGTINKFILIFAMYHIWAALLYMNIRNFTVVTFYGATIVIYGFLSSRLRSIKMCFVYAILIANYINITYFFVAAPIQTRYKAVGPIKIFISYYDTISFSSTTLIALLAIILVFYLKRRSFLFQCIKVSTILTGLYIIFISGKVSVIAGLVCTCIVIPLFFYKGKFVYLTRILSYLIILVSVSFHWILEFCSGFLLKLGINYHHLSSGRDTIWSEYLDYFNNLPLFHKLFGSFFIRTYNDQIKKELPHPHNQWILLLISIGIIGLVFYFVLLKKAFSYTIDTKDKVGFAYLLVICIYAIMDDYVFFTPACIYMFLLIYYAVQKDASSTTGKGKGSCIH